MAVNEDGVDELILDRMPDATAQGTGKGAAPDEGADAEDEESDANEATDADADVDAEADADDGEGDGDDADDDEKSLTDRDRLQAARRQNRRLQKSVKGQAKEVSALNSRLAESARRTAELEAELAALKGEEIALDADKIDELDDAAKAVRGVEKRTIERRRKDIEAKQKQSKAEEDSAIASHLEESREAARKDFADYDVQEQRFVRSLQPYGQVGASIARAAAMSPNAASVIYHLATNPEEMREIVSLSAEQQRIEIGRLSARLDLAPATPAKKAKKKAPEPLTSVSKGAAETSSVPSLDAINKAFDDGRNPWAA